MCFNQLRFKPCLIAVCLLTCCIAALPTSADIFEWEYIDPFQPELGKQESTTLVPDGAGVDAVPGGEYRFSDLTKAYLINANMNKALFFESTLNNADLSGADLREARFVSFTEVFNVEFSGANIRGAFLGNMTSNGFTKQQLYSTSSYAVGNLAGINFDQNDMTGWDFSGQDLTDVSFGATRVIGTDFTDAIVRGTVFTRIQNYGFTQQQLASTSSYKTGDLSRIQLLNSDMTGWSFAEINLSASNLWASRLDGADLTRTNLMRANGRVTSFVNANLFAVDSRGSLELFDVQIDQAASTQNMVRPDGSIRDGLLIPSGESMWIRDEDGGSTLTPIPITVQTAFDIDPDATLRFIIEDPDWGSTILFDPAVGTANLGGTLELAMKLDDGLTPADLLGATFQLFDWAGVSIVGGFDAFVLDPAWFAAGLSLDRSQLMSTGMVRVVPLIGDLDGDGFVGIGDLNIVLVGWNQSVTPGALTAGDVDGDGFVGIADLNLVLSTWNASVPPPSSRGGACGP